MLHGIFGKARQAPNGSSVAYPVAAEVEAYWQALRQEQSIPLRKDLDPRGIRNALPYAFVLDTSHPSEARFRIAGSHLADLWQADLREETFSSLIVPNSRVAIRTILNDVCAMPALAKMDIQLGDIEVPRKAHLLLLPMTDDFGRVTRLLGCVDFQPGKSITDECSSQMQLTLTGSVIRPLLARDSQGDIIRRMRHPQLSLVAVNSEKRTNAYHKKTTHLRLVTN